MASIPPLLVKNMDNLRDKITPAAWSDVVEREGDSVIAIVRTITEGGKIKLLISTDRAVARRVLEILAEHGLADPEQRQPWETDPEAWKNA